MTTIRQEAYRLIDSLPDSSVSFLVQIIRNMSPAFFHGAVIVEPSALHTEARKKLQQIASLKENWNGNGAEAYTKKHIHRVDELLIALKYTPEVFPTACDTIQFEYDKADGAHLEIEIPEEGDSTFFSVDANGKTKEDSIDTNAEAFNDLIRRFYGSEL